MPVGTHLYHILLVEVFTIMVVGRPRFFSKWAGKQILPSDSPSKFLENEHTKWEYEGLFCIV